MARIDLDSLGIEELAALRERATEGLIRIARPCYNYGAAEFS